MEASRQSLVGRACGLSYLVFNRLDSPRNLSADMIAPPSSLETFESPTRPHIVILGTGGTIAAAASSVANTTDYALTHGIDAVISAVPQLRAVARISGEQVVNVSSQEINSEVLLILAKRVNDLLRSDTVDAVVITHGTDTMEETAYFLNLVVKSTKPVVMVGAMRPSSAMSADGPLNLLNAVTVAAAPQSKGMGVLIVLNDRIGAARYMVKTHTFGTDAFSGQEYGVVGSVVDGKVDFHMAPLRIHTSHSDFDVSGLDTLPAVDIIYGFQGAGLHLFEAAISAGVQGIVFAATGNGTLSEVAKKAAVLAQARGIAFVRSTRVVEGAVSIKSNDVEFNTVASNSLNPQKARVLLTLALTLTNDRERLQNYFDHC